MKKKILLLSLFFLIPILINNSYAKTTCEILNDTHVEQNNPTNNYGTQTTTEIRIHTSNARRSYHLFGNCDENITAIISAEACFYVGSNAGTDETQVYWINNSSSINETGMIWNNQPCGIGYNDTTNCNLTIQDEQIVDSVGWHCWDITNAVTEAWENNETEFAFSLRTYENDTVASSDAYRSKENVNEATRPILNITQSLETELEIISELAFGLDEMNLVQANYTLLENNSIVLNATCNLTFDTDSGLMTYNNTTLLYEIFVIPEELGILNLTVNCTKENHDPQIDSSSTTVFFLSGVSYNITIGLFENLNATTPYIDEFAYILLNAGDYNCSTLSGYESCWRIGEYTNGIAYINDTVAIGNFSIYFYSGSVIQTCDICPPHYETFTNLKHLGDFIFNENRTTLYLYISAVELNWQRELQDWILTDGISLIALIGLLLLSFVGGILMFAQSADFKASIFTIISVIVIGIILLGFLGIDVGLSTIIGILLP